ncbi:hypothetical protein [Neisseria weaveri]|uniref:Uncharacterized protein n=1 Tax=Neisseria weaveri TaxID=28091 RepID=A0A3S5B5X2_9NEIS|nr:hypothetical protein [Neisseria weaveri]EGV35478.1 hypothetical protein l13_14950 [Neisseria weaveri ATCC 51223]EGV37774.1 hypothetical protein l11_10150 [Neisseria weaveri LMG 5135]SAY50444.1 Uncharacterised protein [Neisseria weaveri]VEJ51853.1 Uncharacterised protein [Neisseria weaveri]
MFKRPEEIILAVLAGLWVILTYLAANYLGMPMESKLTVTGFTLLWAIVCFMLWQRNLNCAVWPFFFGALVACWWPYLDWLAVRDITALSANDTIVIAKPWYATWTFKGIAAAIPVVIGYLVKWKRYRARKQIFPSQL